MGRLIDQMIAQGFQFGSREIGRMWKYIVMHKKNPFGQCISAFIPNESFYWTNRLVHLHLRSQQGNIHFAQSWSINKNVLFFKFFYYQPNLYARCNLQICYLITHTIPKNPNSLVCPCEWMINTMYIQLYAWNLIVNV